MKAGFIKRLGAFIIDTIILSVIFSVITMGFNTNTSDINKELIMMLEQYENGEITIEYYSDKVTNLNFKLQKSSIMVNTVTIVIYFGYFVVFGYLNKGQTLGKKLCKIKVVNKNNDRPSILNMIVRSLFIYGMSTLLFSILFVDILGNKIFTYGYTIITYVETIFMIICFFMVLYKKDGKGLHDLMANTYVIEEVK